MLSNSLNSQFVLLDSVSATDATASKFGQNIQFLSSDLFAITSDLTSPWITDDISFSDLAYFDGGGTEFGELETTFGQKVDIFQILETKRSWINSTQDILSPVPVTTIPINGQFNTDIVYSGAIDNLFLSDITNPNEAIKIFSNPTLAHGWTVFTAQQQKLDPGSISRSWIYDSVTRIKLADLEVVDLTAGIMPGTIASELDFVCDIDPAVYNIQQWIPGTPYNIGDRVIYNGLTYQALYAGKSGSVFNAALWTLIPTNSVTNASSITKWGSAQVGRTWFKTAKLKTINAQLGTLTERAQNWNTWFPNATIEVFEWVTSSVPPTQYTNSDENGYILDQNCAFTYDAASGLYGFWVFAKNSLGPIHNQTAAQLIGDIENIPSSGIPMITAIDNNAVAVWNINQFVSLNTVILHIDYVTKSSDNQLHNEFALISNDGSKAWYKTAIYPKLVDSLSGVSAANQLVPDYTLPIQQQAGILNNPVQSLFVNRTTALDIYFSVINTQLANLAIATSAVISALSAADPLPTSGFNDQVPNRAVLDELDPSMFPANYRILVVSDDTLMPTQWSIVANADNTWEVAQHQLYNLVNNWEYADWFAPDFTNAPPTYVLDNLGELSEITYQAGNIIQINNNGSGNKALYLAVINDIDPNVTELDPIYIQNGTIQFLPNLYDFLDSGIGFDNQLFDSQGFDNDPYLAIRLITQILNDTVFIGSNSLTQAADNSFYAILNYIFFENENLDWLFKTSFVTVDYNNRNLGVQGTFQPDNQASIEDFVSETLPFHTRVREFRNTYTSNDYANVGAVDFDLPSQYDMNYANIVYNFTANPKLNATLPLREFRKNVGVALDSRSVYITSSGIPMNPTMSSNIQDWSFGIVTKPITIPIKYATVPNIQGPIAVAIDGVPFFSPNSGITETLYQYGNVTYPFANIANSATYTINSVFAAENQGGDPGAGYTNLKGQYIYQANPYVMANVAAIGDHSPLIGYAWDGNPIYGPFGYANADGSGGIILNTSSYQLSTTPRLDKTGQPFINGLQMAQYVAPTGAYIEDFIYVPNSGTLDECNGRFVVTPEYLNGVYAYFASAIFSNIIFIDTEANDDIITENVINLITENSANVSSSSPQIPTYPYVIGPAYNSKPFGLQYTYINGINTPIYPNGQVPVPGVPFIDTVDLIRTPDGSVPSDSLTLLEPVYAPWSNNHTYFIETLSVERTGEGYLDLTADIVISPTNNAAANVQSLQLVSANLVLGGNNYVVGENVAVLGGTYINVATIQVTNVNVAANNSIVTFMLNPVTDQFYTVVPANITNVATLSINGNGSGATFNVAFGLESIFISNNGNDFIYTPIITVIDDNAAVPATVYPILENTTVRKIDTTITFDRVAGGEYSGVFVEGGEFISSYTVPNGTIFDSDDSTAGQISLNISWRPELISDTALSTEYSRFGNSAGVFNAEIGQYITANAASPDLNLLSINANSFTLEFFMNFSNLTNNLGVMIDTRDNIVSANGLVVFREGSNLCIGSNTNVSLISSGVIPFTENNWEYVTIQGNSGNLYAYMNGQLVGTANIAYNFSDANITFGADVSGSNVSTGYMDEIRLTTQYNRYIPSIINITVPTAPFSRSITVDPYLLPQYTPLLWGFENFVNESETNITFVSVNSQTLISDLSWNQKKLQLVNYGSDLIIDGSTINILENPQTSQILEVTLNRG